MLPMPKALLAILAAIAVSGCSSFRPQSMLDGNLIYRQPIFQGTLLEQSHVEQLQKGLSQQQVLALLGTPPLADPFHKDRWDYAASQQRLRNPAEIKNLTLWFENNSLVKWEGEYFPEQDSALVQEMRKFGNLPKDKDKDKKRRR